MTNTITNTCIEVKENLSAHLDNALDAEQTNIIKEHLQSCDECAKEFDELKEIVSLLSGTQNVKIPDSFDFGLMQTLHHEKAKKSSIFKRKMTMISSIAAVFVIGIFSIAMYNHMSGLNNDANLNYAMPQPAIMADMADMAGDMAGAAAGNGALPETEEAELELFSRELQIFGNFGTVIPYGTHVQREGLLPSLWSGQRFADECGEPLGLTHDRTLTQSQRDLTLVWAFLYEQYYIAGSDVNINFIDTIGTNVSSFNVVTGNVFTIELITDELTEVHTLLVVDGKVSLLKTEVFDYAKPIRPIIGQDDTDILTLEDMLINE